jgi:hypothetical protein
MEDLVNGLAASGTRPRRREKRCIEPKPGDEVLAQWPVDLLWSYSSEQGEEWVLARLALKLEQLLDASTISCPGALLRPYGKSRRKAKANAKDEGQTAIRAVC